MFNFMEIILKKTHYSFRVVKQKFGKNTHNNLPLKKVKIWCFAVFFCAIICLPLLYGYELTITQSPNQTRALTHTQMHLNKTMPSRN